MEAGSYRRVLLKISGEALLGDLSKLCRAEILGPCASLSLVGRNIRAIEKAMAEIIEKDSPFRREVVSVADARGLQCTLELDPALPLLVRGEP